MRLPEAPSGHLQLIDCGKADYFSPVKFIVENQVDDAATHLGHKLTRLIVTHPHDDHIEDIGTVINQFEPAILLRQEYGWDDIKAEGSGGDYENLDLFAEWQSKYNHPAQLPNFGFQLETYYLTPSHARLVDEEKFVNNSSIVVVVTFKGTVFTEKFLFGGDMEVDGWEELLKQDAFRNAIKETDFYVTSHHGHESGFSTKLFEAMGKPILNIVSAHRKDESVDDRYSKEEFARGSDYNGERRRMLSTRHDGTICIDVNDEGKFTLSTGHLKDNIRRALAAW